MKIVFVFSFILSVSLTFGQFEFKREYSISPSTENWFVDAVGNIFLLENNKVKKMDSSGRITFVQSIKSLGEINQLVFNSAQKIICFSEEQQQLCVFDNTLTPISDCISLDQLGIVNANRIASSSRANAIWLYDQVNSTLLLLDVDKKFIIKELKNAAGLVGISDNLTYMVEDDEKLWVSDGKATYSFDMNLSFLEKRYLRCDEKSFIANHVYFEFYEEEFSVINLPSDEEGIGENPVPNVESVKFANDNFYFKKANTIFVYKIP